MLEHTGPRGSTIRHHGTPSEVFSTRHCLHANMPDQSAIYLPSRMEDWAHDKYLYNHWPTLALIKPEKQPQLGDTFAARSTLFLGLKQAFSLIKIKYHYLLLGHLPWHSRADVLHHYTPVKFGQWGKTPCYGSPGQHLLKSEAFNCNRKAVAWFPYTCCLRAFTSCSVEKTAWLWSQPDRGGKTLEEVTAAPEGKDALQSDVFTCAQALSCWVLEDDGLPGVFRGQAATWLDGECTSVSPGLPAKNRTKASRSYSLVFQSWLNTFLPPWKHCFLKNINHDNRNLRNTHCNNRKLENLFRGCSLIWSTGCCQL